MLDKKNIKGSDFYPAISGTFLIVCKLNHFYLQVHHFASFVPLRFEATAFVLFKTRPRGYKTFFMLNSSEHEILNAHKYKKYQEIQNF